MIEFLLGSLFTLCLTAAAYLVFRSRPGTAPPPPVAAPPAKPQPVRASEPQPTRDLLNLESAIDIRKAMRGVSAIQRQEEIRKRGA